MKNILLTVILFIFALSYVSATSTQMWVGGDDSNVGTLLLRFYFPMGGGEFQGATEFPAQRICYAAANGFFSDLKIKQAAGPGSQPDLTRFRQWTVRINNVDTLLSCRVVENGTECEDTYFKAFMNVDDTVLLTTSGFGGASANDVGGRIDWSMKFTSTDANNTSFYCGNSAQGLIGSTTMHIPFTGIQNFGGSADIDDAQMLITDDEFHTAKNMVVHLTTAPGVDNNRTFTFLGGGASTMTCVIKDLETSCINDTERISIGVASEISIRGVSEGGPPSSAIQVSVGIESTTSNLFMLPASSNELAVNVGTRFGYVSTGDNEWEATESVTQLMASNLGSFNSLNITRLRAKFEISPGFGSPTKRWTMNVRNNGVNQFSCTTSSVATNCIVSGNFSLGETDLLSVSLQPIFTPRASQLIYTLQGELSPMSRTVIYGARIYGAKIY